MFHRRGLRVHWKRRIALFDGDFEAAGASDKQSASYHSVIVAPATDGHPAGRSVYRSASASTDVATRSSVISQISARWLAHFANRYRRRNAETVIGLTVHGGSSSHRSSPARMGRRYLVTGGSTGEAEATQISTRVVTLQPLTFATSILRRTEAMPIPLVLFRYTVV